ncbi:MAG TPA: RNA polymerase factor sigma-54 [Ktedonobacterales bacterium]|nr:RNA polymerase factor sigma-54 [Ktedonobacterales bacterium]
MPLQMEQLAVFSQEQQPSQWLVMATQVLAVSSSDLMSLVRQEAAENPALEVEEYPHCLTCGQALQGSYCHECVSRGLAAASQPGSQSERDDLAPSPEQAPALGNISDAFDASMYVPASVSLAEVLTRALQAELPAEDTPIIEYLVGNLDEHGYLRSSTAEAAQALSVSPEWVERVLAQLQTLDPPGIVARSIRECLLLQLRALEAEGQPQPVARAVVDRFLGELSRGHYSEIARQLGLTRRAVEQAHDFIRQRLTPFPTQGYVEGQTNPELDGLRPVVPDVIIRRRPEGEMPPYEIEVVEAQRFSVRIDPAYVAAYRQLGKHEPMAAGEREQLYQSMTRARFFLSSLKQRWQTLAKITWGLIERQAAFLEQGNGALVPLTRAELAEGLGVHPSTVSRATADKYIMLPNAQVVPFATFFTASLPIKAALQDILEQASKPLSDQRLTELLAAQGIQVARRTVTKYRAELGQPASFRRAAQMKRRAS